MKKSLNKIPRVILGIESSCDETAVGVVVDNELKANVIASSMDEHKRFGGVVPEIAARAHLEAIKHVIIQAIRDAGLDSIKQIDAVAVTEKPGLIGSLTVGISAGQAIAYALGKPLFLVNHILAHAFSATINNDIGDLKDGKPVISLVVSGGHSSIYLLNSGHDESDNILRNDIVGGDCHTTQNNNQDQKINFPLKYPKGDKETRLNTENSCNGQSETGIIQKSDGRSQNDYALMGNSKNNEIADTNTITDKGSRQTIKLDAKAMGCVEIGRTLDDAPGETFDKVARMLGLAYPGGPHIDKLAQSGQIIYNFPKGLTQDKAVHKHPFDFSFSGVKTAVLYELQNLGMVDQMGRYKAPTDSNDTKPQLKNKCDIAASLADAVTSVLVGKTLKAAKKYRAQTILVGGGFAANSQLRDKFIKLNDLSKSDKKDIFVAENKYCTDNGAMVGNLVKVWFQGKSNLRK